MTRNQLVDVCSKICYYAQSHSQDWRQDHRDELAFQHTSFTVACFLAQNMSDETQGVDWDVVLEPLTEPFKTLGEWNRIIEDTISEYSK